MVTSLHALSPSKPLLSSNSFKSLDIKQAPQTLFISKCLQNTPACTDMFMLFWCMETIHSKAKSQKKKNIFFQMQYLSMYYCCHPTHEGWHVLILKALTIDIWKGTITDKLNRNSDLNVTNINWKIFNLQERIRSNPIKLYETQHTEGHEGATLQKYQIACASEEEHTLSYLQMYRKGSQTLVLSVVQMFWDPWLYHDAVSTFVPDVQYAKLTMKKRALYVIWDLHLHSLIICWSLIYCLLASILSFLPLLPEIRIKEASRQPKLFL